MNRLIILIHILLSFNFRPIGSIMAKSSHFTVHQNGKAIRLYLKGNAFQHWTEDRDGYLVVKSWEDFFYASHKASNGSLLPSKFKIGHHDPNVLPSLDRSLRPGKKIPGPKNGHAERESEIHMPQRRLEVSTTGSLKNLVIPIRFSDHVDRLLPSREDIELLWNAPGGHPTWYESTNMSTRDFYFVNSYVLDWVTVSQEESYYAAGVSGGGFEINQLLNEVLNIVDTSLDFTMFDANGDNFIDAIAFVHSGYGAEFGGTDADGAYLDDRIWSHKYSILSVSSISNQPWTSQEGVMVFDYHMETILDGTSGSTISTIAVGAHETGHFLGLPDLYDTDDSSTGIGAWGVMAYSWGWDSTGEFPPSFSVWSKQKLGWIKPKNISQPGVYTLNDIETHDDAFIISSPYPEGEYLLIENRQPKLCDRQIPLGGLLIWHIDSWAAGNNFEGYWGQDNWPENGLHYQVALLQADGEFDLEQGFGSDAGDIFSTS